MEYRIRISKYTVQNAQGGKTRLKTARVQLHDISTKQRKNENTNLLNPLTDISKPINTTL